ncbi:recombinase family protein [Parasphingorhabdus cellanae]|uniref:recombinase family protein n=1 Tax=Parasphingorhabdus cellanae TaxID=2806553 RepID=UPI0021756677|nr:recombinase family protein [Parasphingorhabdus cellanae]
MPKIVEILDENEASFVSVTQSFNTTNSMGRLTLNVLLSFAQFEREVTGERIRDKVAASKKKGMWMGGPVPLGYRIEERKLLFEPSEVESVRYIFDRYIELKSVPKMVDDLAAKDFRTRKRVLSSGRVLGGVHIGTGALTLMLQNPIYFGKIRHRGELYDGEHEPIIPQELFDRVQSIFSDNRRDKTLGKKSRNPSLLTGMITDPDGRPMSPTQSKKQSRTYRYYSTRFKPLQNKTSAWHLPAGELEELVIKAVANHLSHGLIWKSEDGTLDKDRIDQYRETAKNLTCSSIVEQRKFLLKCQTKVQVEAKAVKISLSIEKHPDPINISVDAKLVSKGSELRLAVTPDNSSAKHEPDPVLLRLIAQAFAARDYLIDGIASPNISDYSQRHLRNLARLSFLAPDIITAIVRGSQPVNLTGRRLLRAGDLPLDWAGQRTLLGFE